MITPANRKWREANPDKVNEWNRKSYHKHAIKILAIRKQRRQENIEEVLKYEKNRRIRDKEKNKIRDRIRHTKNKKTRSQKSRIKRQNRKLLVLAHYSICEYPICAVSGCGITDLDMLTLDHINGGGNKHREKIGRHLYEWIIENDYPLGFQDLCWNHNLKKELKDKGKHKNKIDILTHYSLFDHPQCAYPDCLVMDLDMLTLDHINDDGAEHRKKLKKSVYLWIIENNYPPGFQDLCWNHNIRKEVVRRKEIRYNKEKEKSNV